MFRYFGPPGTGKTTTLLNQVDELLVSGMSPNEIGYFAFTRKAAHEARDRAVVRFNLDQRKTFNTSAHCTVWHSKCWGCPVRKF